MKNIALYVMVTFISASALSADIDKKVLKMELVKLAKSNTTNVDNRTEIRSQIEKIVATLTKYARPIDEKTWSQFSPGSWKQIWSDEANNDPSPAQQNLDAIYQYVSPEGRALNLGERMLPDGGSVTFALEALGKVSANVQNTQILSGFFKPTGLLSSMSIEYLAQDILDKKFKIFTAVELGVFPMGPIGAESDLTFLYLDEDLKIGTAPNVFTRDIEMFVLERTPIIP